MRLLTLLLLVFSLPAQAQGFGEALGDRVHQDRQLQLQERAIDLEYYRLQQQLQMQQMIDLQREQLKMERERQFRQKLDGIGKPWGMEDLR